MKFKSALLLGGAVALFYVGSLMIRAHQSEQRAEEYLEAAMLDVAKPWVAEKLENRASSGFLEKAKLKPRDISQLAENSLGALVKIVEQPQCNLQRGTDPISDGEHTYAMCEFRGVFEKATVVMKITLQDDGDWKEGQWKIHHFTSVN